MSEQHRYTARLAQIQERTPLEADIMALVARIERMGGHPLLTDTQNLLFKAFCAAGAWHDAGEPGGVKP